jgi:Cu-Zn family superoxide dismutase
MGSSATDPMYANPMNEIWLDFKTDPLGNGSANRTVDFAIMKENAKAVVIHDQATKTGAGEAGTAGAKLACVNLKLD